MSTRSLSKELLEQLGQGRFTSPWRFDGVDAPADYVLRVPERDFVDRVAFVKAMMGHGLPLRASYDLLNQLAATLLEPPEARRGVPVRVPSVPDPEAFEATMAAHGVMAERRHVPETVDVRALRERLGMSREEFAIRFGLDARTIEAWEQGRRQPEPATRILLKVIERDPAVVEAVLAA